MNTEQKSGCPQPDVPIIATDGVFWLLLLFMIPAVIFYGAVEILKTRPGLAVACFLLGYMLK